MGHQPDRYFEAVKHDGQPGYWRTTADAPKGSQVKFLWPDGKWRPSFMFATEASLVQSLAKSAWREITAEEVPPCPAS